MYVRTRAFNCWALALVCALTLPIAGCFDCGSGGCYSGPPLAYLGLGNGGGYLFNPTVVGATAMLSNTISNTGNATLNFSAAITGATSAPFSLGGNCGSSIAPYSNCSLTVTFNPTTVGVYAGTIVFTTNATGPAQTLGITGTGTVANATYTASASTSSLTFAPVAIGTADPNQTVTFTNTGTGPLAISAVQLPLVSLNIWTLTTNCPTLLLGGATCTATVGFLPTGSGVASSTVSFYSTAVGSPQVVNLSGTGLGTASAANTVDCSIATGYCANTFITAGLASDPIAAGLFHGYTDPSMRADPNSSTIYLAYGWPRSLADGTHVVDLHLASSVNNGATFTYLGPLYQSVQTTQSSSTAYANVNDSSTETIDLIPIPLTGASAGQTVWVQAHQSYLVKPQGGTYDQFNATSVISVSAVQLASPASAGAGTALLALGAAGTPEARLGAVSSDATRNITQALAGLTTNASKCAAWGQPALWYQGGALYLSLECNETAANLDGNELAHFVYATTPTGSDASKWTWSYLGLIANANQAAKLGATTAENVAYSFFTAPKFVMTKSGLAVVMTPGVFAASGATQPLTQYGCRVVPVTLTPSIVNLTLDTTTAAPVVIAKVTENDLYTGVNQGPAACTYDPASVTGIVMGRKYENDPTNGFYIYPVNSKVLP